MKKVSKYAINTGEFMNIKKIILSALFAAIAAPSPVMAANGSNNIQLKKTESAFKTFKNDMRCMFRLKCTPEQRKRIIMEGVTLAGIIAATFAGGFYLRKWLKRKKPRPEFQPEDAPAVILTNEQRTRLQALKLFVEKVEKYEEDEVRKGDTNFIKSRIEEIEQGKNTASALKQAEHVISNTERHLEEMAQLKKEQMTVEQKDAPTVTLTNEQNKRLKKLQQFLIENENNKAMEYLIGFIKYCIENIKNGVDIDYFLLQAKLNIRLEREKKDW